MELLMLGMIARTLRLAASRMSKLADSLCPPPPPPPLPPKSLKDESLEKWVEVKGDSSLRLEYPVCAGEVVLDVGGYEGQWASDIYARYRCVMHVFEPVPEFAERIEHRFRFNSDIHVHRVALGAREGEVSLSIRGDASSTLLSGENRINVRVQALSDWCEKARVTEVALMKVNIEGAEYELLQHMIDTGLIKNIRNLQIQFHDFVSDAESRMSSLLSALSVTHRPTYQFPFIWESWTRLETTR